MDRRPSIISVSSLGSLSGLLKPVQLPTLPESSFSQAISQNGTTTMSRKLSLSEKLEHSLPNSEAWDPDDLFTKYTVAEVKVIQQRLRSDADAKQEELRLMVGERYRDLLQASTSIMSISESSQRVVARLHDMRRVSSSVESIHSPKTSLSGHQDSHLHALQSLAAHMKLLLDAPEHLWRLLERKAYLNAAWLFLLSRVVHRSLLREQDDEEAAWSTSGIDISDQFPLVQRQWETVSGFRAQITHKATLSLREASTTPAEVCATLLTLHLLESRPLPETLATLLGQRSRTLSSALAGHSDGVPNGSLTGSSNFGASASAPARSRKIIVREVRQKLKAVLEILSRTVETARAIFIGDVSHPLMSAVLEHIQADSPQAAFDLPPELRLTSSTLLSTLPSSSHFLLLPPNVRLYKPYIDSSSLSTAETTKQLVSKLNEWFQKSLRQVQQALELWFADLTSVREVWKLRKWASTWISSTEALRAEEKALLYSSLDDVCRQRTTSVWKSALTSIAADFREQLQNSLQSLESSSFDTQPVQYLFRTPSMPQVHAATLTATSASFDKFKVDLQQQLTYRTPLLNDALSIIESHVQALHDEVQVIQAEGGSSSSLPAQLVARYRDDAGLLCSSVTQTLQDSLEGLRDDTESVMRYIAFISRVAKGLSTSSVLTSRLDCEISIIEGFRSTLESVADKSASRWHDFLVSQVLERYWLSISPESNARDHSPRPSSALLECLLYLASSIQRTNALSDASRQSQHVFARLVQKFVASIDEHVTPEREETQLAWDMVFLLHVAVSWGPVLKDTASLLRSKIEGFAKSDGSSRDIDMSNHLLRTQQLLGVLLPASPQSSTEKPSSLLPFGTPVSDTSHTPTLQLVKPSARFGLLLVGSSYSR